MDMNATLTPQSTLSAVVTRKNGDVQDLGVISSDLPTGLDTLKDIFVNGKRRLYEAADKLLNRPMNLVVSAGVTALATNFTASPSVALANFKYLDCGTGTTAAASGDTALQTPAGTARVAGTVTNPSNGVAQFVGTISYTSSLAITEFGLFSATTSGTLFDHHVFAAINVSNGDQITFTLQVTCSGS